MKAHFGLPSVVGDLNEGKPPISVKFEIPYFTTSGIQVPYPLGTRVRMIQVKHRILVPKII
jgi:hypothetical protein